MLRIIDDQNNNIIIQILSYIKIKEKNIMLNIKYYYIVGYK